MASTYWFKQSADEPLFPDLFWSRPENKLHAGKLLIIGGNLHGFNAPAEAYTETLKAGIGFARVLLPDALSKTVSRIFPEAEYAPSTPSGSFARISLSELLEAAEWADGVLLAGNFGKNSETEMLMESFILKYSGQLTVTGDSVEYFLNRSETVKRPETVFVCEFGYAQKLLIAGSSHKAMTSDMGAAQIAVLLHEFTGRKALNIVFSHNNVTFVACNSRISTTPEVRSPLKTAATATTWWLQNPSKTFEALTTAIL